ncbi:transcriptional regulator [Caballeronia arvi]|uniref:Transcriptional regulator n=1 Tax=Caballeronia arvi TaxID=1777135 RepID=A0A158KSS0_9BURK|nr:GlxA family transcriptional regulator [Caballeronia arvi]SAL83481.1 transcriptional regulator [Caballeronia arvi]
MAAIPLNFGFLLLPEYSMMTLASATEPLRMANRLSGEQLYRWHLLSATGSPISSSSGFALETASIQNKLSKEFDWIFVIAGFGHETHRDPAIHRYLQLAAGKGVGIGAMSTGSFVLARAGLLRGYRCTLHWEALRQFSEEFPGIEVQRELYVRDRSRLTCAGGTAGIDLMLDQISADHGVVFAAEVADVLLHSRIRGADEFQRMAVNLRYHIHDARIVKAVELMEQNLESPISLDEMAALCSLSVRQLERLWRQIFECSPKTFYVNLRLAEARRLLRESTESKASIAMRCGFSSASHLGAAYIKRYGRSPGLERPMSVGDRSPT